MSGKLVLGPSKKEPEASKEEVISGISISLDGFDEGAVGDNKKRYRFKDGRPWLHPPEKLIKDKVIYRCTHLGAMEVSEAKGSGVVRDAVDRLKLVAEVKRSDGMLLPEVDICICIRNVTIMDVQSKIILHQHPLHQISFCAEDKREHANTFAYISRAKPRSKEHTCYVYETKPKQAEEITTTIGQAFEVAFQRYQETRQAQEDFKNLKEKLQSDAEKEDFAKQLKELQKQVEQMELDSEKRHRPPLEKFPTVIAQWESITHALEPFTMEPDMDPRMLHLVPRPETKELDSAINKMESQLKDLEEGFGRKFTVGKLSAAATKPFLVAQHVLSDIEGQVKSMQLQNESLDEPDLPANYQMKEFVQAKEMPKKGTVKEATGSWEGKGK